MKTKEKSSTMFSCSHCDKVFKYNSERMRHETSHLQNFECELCNKKFGYISALRRHKKQHERTSSVKCKECNRKFRDEILLQRHIKYAHKGTFSCPKCGSTFSSDLALRTHQKTHKPAAERRFKCTYKGCDKSFNFSHHLKHHELTHSNAKQHFCGVCGKGFIQSHHLKTHLKSHYPSEWLYCDFKDCVKKFSTEYTKKRHMSTAHKTKPDSGISSDSNSCDGPMKSYETYEDSYKGDDVQIIDVRGTLIPPKNETDGHIDGNSVYTTKVPGSPIELNSVNKSEAPCSLYELNSVDLSGVLGSPMDFNPVNLSKSPGSPIELNSLYFSSVPGSPIEFNSVNTAKVHGSPIEFNSVADNNKLKAIITSNETLEAEIEDCKLAVGSCIANDSCICEEINKTVKNINVTSIENSIEKTSFIAKNSNNNNHIVYQSMNDESNKNSAILIKKEFNINNNNSYDKSNGCEGCDCASICTDEDRAICNTRKPNNLPNIEKTNGVIKLKDTFDIDFEVGSNKGESFVPFSTCKDVIGKCIVEGDGCLCARMIADEQQAMAQEIDDITPQPKTD